MSGKLLVVFLLCSSILSAQQLNLDKKLTKFALSQAVFAGMGIIDYSIKEAPKYPLHREDSFFWQTAWGGMMWGGSAGINLLLVKDPKYLAGILTEDITYYVCRALFHKQAFPKDFGLPIKIFGADKVPMTVVFILWGASITYLLLDSLDLI